MEELQASALRPTQTKRRMSFGKRFEQDPEWVYEGEGGQSEGEEQENEKRQLKFGKRVSEFEEAMEEDKRRMLFGKRLEEDEAQKRRMNFGKKSDWGPIDVERRRLNFGKRPAAFDLEPRSGMSFGQRSDDSSELPVAERAMMTFGKRWPQDKFGSKRRMTFGKR